MANIVRNVYFNYFTFCMHALITPPPPKKNSTLRFSPTPPSLAAALIYQSSVPIFDMEWNAGSRGGVEVLSDMITTITTLTIFTGKLPTLKNFRSLAKNLDISK